MAIVCPDCPQDACCHFTPTSPDLFIKNSKEKGKMTIARFAHLNHLVDMICCMSDAIAALQSGSVQSIVYCGVTLTEVAGVVTIPAIATAPVGPTEALTGNGCAGTPLSVCIDGTTITKDINGCLQALPSGVGAFADFFAEMPGDNAATVAIGAGVEFPQNGPTSATSITRLTATTFNLAVVGTYEVTWQVSVTEAGQLGVFVAAGTVVGYGAGAPTTGKLPYTTAGRATGTSQIVNTVLITTTVINTVISIHNQSSAAALTITPIAGGTEVASAHLVIKRLA